MNIIPPHFHYSHARQLSVVLALIVSLMSFSAHAEKLTDNTIRAFITTLEKVQAMESEFEELVDQQNTRAPDLSRILSSSIAEFEGEEVYDRLENLVQDNGFSDISEWAATGDRIYGAWIALEISNQSPKFREEMENMLAEVEKNPHITAEQKALMRDSVKTSLSQMQQATEIPSADIEAIKPHLQALRTATDYEED